MKCITHLCMHTSQTPNLWFWPKRPPSAFSVAETSVAEMSRPKRPRPKCPWPKCPSTMQPYKTGYFSQYPARGTSWHVCLSKTQISLRIRLIRVFHGNSMDSQHFFRWKTKTLIILCTYAWVKVKNFQNPELLKFKSKNL